MLLLPALTGETDVQALKELYEELIAFYGYEQESKMAALTCTKWLEASLPGVERDAEISLGGKQDPNDPDAKYEYKKTYGELIDALARDGSHATFRRRGLIALIYALWEHRSRELIAQECSRAKNDVKSVVFQDLGKYRHAIVHSGGKLGKEPKIVCFFRKGDVVSLTQGHIQKLFSILIGELNRIGEVYYKENPRFSLKKSLHP